MQFSVKPRKVAPEPGDLGYAWIPLAMSAASAAMDSRKSEGGGGTAAETEQNAGMPGSNASVPRQPSAMTTVSPTIQAQISPQISPVMTQQQSSPGASVSANPMQYMPGGQTAEGGGTTGAPLSPYGNYAAPGFPSGPGAPYPYSPGMQYSIDPVTGMPVPSNYYSQGGYGSPVTVGAASMQDLPWTAIAIAGAAAVGAVFLFGKKKRAKH